MELENFIDNFISLHSQGYGRTMMEGSIKYTLGISSGIISHRCVGRSLKRLAPLAYEARARDTFDKTNPIAYFAPYFGYKGVLDQNGKTDQEYGCTHVALTDGCSQMICGYASMEVKNPILI